MWLWLIHVRVRYAELEDRLFFRHRMTVSLKSNPVPQIQCVAPVSVCDEYPSMVVNCSLSSGSHEVDHWGCIGVKLHPRHAISEWHITCEDWDESGDDFVSDESCFISLHLDEDVVYDSNFGSKYMTVIYGFLVFVCLWSILTLLVWIFPDISLFEPHQVDETIVEEKKVEDKEEETVKEKLD
jgi:hypothetical protein